MSPLAIKKTDEKNQKRAATLGMTGICSHIVQGSNETTPSAKTRVGVIGTAGVCGNRIQAATLRPKASKTATQLTR